MKYKTAINIYNKLNFEIFGNLIDTRIYFSRARNLYGHYDNNGIGINPRNHNNIIELTETIFHEMIHVFIEEILLVDDTSEHGYLFTAWYYRLLPDYIKPNLENYYD